MAQRGTLQITFLGFNVLFWVIGIALVIFVSWTLSTLPSSTDFMSSAFGLLYACLLLGIIILFTGACGCVGGLFRALCLLKTYFGFMIAFIFVEMGIAIAYHLLEDQVPALLISTWPQLNNDTKFTLQRQLGCCGIQNYTEWSVELDQIPYSCFKVYGTLSVTTKAWTLLFKSSCLDQLEEWFKDNLPIWASLLTFIALVQICSMFLSGLVINRIMEQMKVTPADEIERSRRSSMSSAQSGPSGTPVIAISGTQDDVTDSVSETKSEHAHQLDTIEEEAPESEEIVPVYEVENNEVDRKSIASENLGETDSGRPRSSSPLSGKENEGLTSQEIRQDEPENNPQNEIEREQKTDESESLAKD